MKFIIIEILQSLLGPLSYEGSSLRQHLSAERTQKSPACLKVNSLLSLPHSLPVTHTHSVRPDKWPAQISLSRRCITMATTALPLSTHTEKKGGVELWGLKAFVRVCVGRVCMCVSEERDGETDGSFGKFSVNCL